MATEREIRFWKRQREGVRTHCTAEIVKSRGYLDQNAEVTTPQLQSSVTVLKDFRAALSKFDGDILLNTDDDNIAQNEVETATAYDYNLLQHISDLTAKLESVLSICVAAKTGSHVSTAIEHSRPGSPTNSLSFHSGSDSRGQSVNLPKIQIAKFNGDPLKWAEFWDNFTSTIHENDRLPDIEKFKYLRSFLQGDAFRVIDGYRLSSANYAQAVEYLNERYGNEQLAVFSHFKTMIELPAAGSDTNQLQSVYDECEKHIRSLVALGLEEAMFGEVFTPLILSKLPSDVKMELYRRNGSKTWELSNLREWLKEEIRARDYSQRTFGTSPSSNGHHNDRSSGRGNSSRSDHRHGQRQRQQGTSSALIGHEKATSRGKCVFCNGSHYSDRCDKFPDIQSRKSCLVGRCYICLSKQHSAKECESDKVCYHCGKQGHNRSICYSKIGSRDSRPVQDSSLQVADDQFSSDTRQLDGNLPMLSHGQSTILQTALCRVQGKQSISTARILFDTGCTRTFITKDLCQRIGARHLGTDRVSIAGFTSKKRVPQEYESVEFDVTLSDGTKKTLVTNVIDTITAPIQKIPLDVKSNPGLVSMKLAEPLVSSRQQVHVDILLGTDYYYEFIWPHRIEMKGGLILLTSSLGLIATGKVSHSYGKENSLTSLYASVHPKSTLDIEKFWSLEDIGVKSPCLADGDEEAMATFNRTVKFEDGRYQVRLPYKSDTKELPENRNKAYACLVSQLKRLKSDPEILKKYDSVIQDQLSKDVVEVAPEVPTGTKVHYLPHHCVVTPNKATTKVRVVYNASAKAGKDSPSLNDCLNRGPVILDDLCGLLIKFRSHPIGLVSDIEKAFLQVGLQQCDRDVTRFFWIKDTSKTAVGDNLVTLRFTRVLFGAISSPFLLGATVEHHLKKNQSTAPVAKDIKGHVYVDNVINGKSTVDEAVTFYREAKKLFTDASMNLREWFTNSIPVREQINTADRGDTSITKVLGLKWDTDKDTLSCGSFVVQEDSINTKRLMLKYLAKVFDPCGYYSAVTVAGKLIIQKLWQTKHDWDDVVSDDIVEDWRKCCNSLQRIGSHIIPRCYNVDIHSDGATYDLHCFCDASGKAYAAVVYIVVTTSSGVSANIVFAKSRVAPIKPLTIPRLELMAAVIGVRIMSFVKSSLGLPVRGQFVWSDSKCVLHWLIKSSVDSVFVRNRVAEINSHKGVQFRYVPTDKNPADLSSRGCSFDFIINNSLWWNGPEWLTDSNIKWPENISSPIGQVEIEAFGQDTSHEVVNIALEGVLDSSIEVDRFSSLTRLVRVTAWVHRFIFNVKNSVKCSGPLTALEIAAAESYWNKKIQEVYFNNLMFAKDSQSKNRVKQLDLFVDSQGMIRCGGRLSEAHMEYDAKHPILLPKNTHYADLVITDCHRRLLHAGVTHTLAQLREKYWIVHGRNQVKRVIRSCYICKVAHGGPYRYPDPPSLPSFRVNRQKPFETVGVDYLGPLFVKDPSSGDLSKVWVSLFTCAVTRAIHLEIIDNLSACQFLMCLRRFVSDHGTPGIIVSDNAKHFHKIDRHLNKVWSEVRKGPEVQDWSSTQGIQWKFIVELSPWMGGFYERMVGIVKVSLKKLLDNCCVSKTELQTILVECASVINSRPLTYVDNSETGPSPLTPAHFLGGPHSMMPDVQIDTDNFEPRQVKDTELVDMWHRHNRVLDVFWGQWKNQYLLSLRERGYQNKQRNTSDIIPSVGDVVIVKDNLLRKDWRIGRVTELPVGKDGKFRSARVKLSNKSSINRPLRLLFPLECGNLNDSENETTTQDQQQKPTEERTRRKAFINARQRIGETVESLSEDDDNDNLTCPQLLGLIRVGSVT